MIQFEVRTPGAARKEVTREPLASGREMRAGGKIAMARDMFSYEADIKKYNKTLRKLSREAIPRAIAATLNRQATITKDRAIANMKKKLTIRTPYTLKSMRISESRPKPNIGAMYSKTGTISPYLPLQETGGVVRARRQRIPIPTTAARRGKSRAGVIAPQFRMSKIGQVGRGSKFFYMRLRKPGIFTRKGKRLIMIRDLSVSSYRIEPTGWFSEAVKKYHNRRFLEKVYVMEAKKEIVRIKGVRK